GTESEGKGGRGGEGREKSMPISGAAEANLALDHYARNHRELPPQFLTAIEGTATPQRLQPAARSCRIRTPQQVSPDSTKARYRHRKISASRLQKFVTASRGDKALQLHHH